MSPSLRVIVAHENDLHAFYRTMLGRMGRSVVATVETGEELVDHFHRLVCNLVISDYELPDMNAIEAAKNIYESEVVPIIHLCRYDHEDVRWQTEQLFLTQWPKRGRG